MAQVRQKVFIDAPPGRVFDVIAQVEDFSRYSKLIKDIKEVRPGIYRWRVEVLGMKFAWEAEVTESKRPVRFAWRSIKGLYNTGSYELEPSDGGTSVTFTMEFRLGARALERFTSPLLERLGSMIMDEVLTNIKKELEHR